MLHQEVEVLEVSLLVGVYELIKYALGILQSHLNALDRAQKAVESWELRAVTIGAPEGHVVEVDLFGEEVEARALNAHLRQRLQALLVAVVEAVNFGVEVGEVDLQKVEVHLTLR